VNHSVAAEGARKSGVELIAEERSRQISVEGWTPEHDDQHTSGELSEAAAGYAHTACLQISFLPSLAVCVPALWPWSENWWKPSSDPIRNLVKAGALIAAEIDRLQRADKSTVQSRVVDPSRTEGSQGGQS
jgi:hypothetical protein